MSKKSDGVVWTILIIVALVIWLWKGFGWWVFLIPTAILVLSIWIAIREERSKLAKPLTEADPQQILPEDLISVLDDAIEEKRQERIQLHRLQGRLTDKEELLLYLAFDKRITLPLSPFHQKIIGHADQVFLTMVHEGYFQAADPVTIIDKTSTVEQLKHILREHDLPLSGRKPELIDRLFMQLPEIAAEIATEKRFYVPTQKGRQLGEYLDEKKRSHAMEHANLCSQDSYLKALRFIKETPDAYGLHFQSISKFCRHSRQLAGICPKDQLPDTWPPPECEHPYHCCNCLFDVVFKNDERLQ